MYDVADGAKFWRPLAFRLLLRPNILCFSWNWKQTNVMEKLRALFDTFMSNYTDSEEVFKTANLERQVQILLNEGVFDNLLRQVFPSPRLKQLVLQQHVMVNMIICHAYNIQCGNHYKSTNTFYDKKSCCWKKDV